MDISLSYRQMRQMAFLAGEEATRSEKSHSWLDAEEHREIAATLWGAMGCTQVAADCRRLARLNAQRGIAEAREREQDAEEEALA